MPFESFCKQFKRTRRSRLTLFSTVSPRGTPSPRGSGSGPAPAPAAVQDQKSHWPDETLTPQAHPIHFTQETTEKPWSHLESEGTHVAKTNLHKIWAYQRSKGFSGFLNVTKRFFLSFFRHVLFLFLLFFFPLSEVISPLKKAQSCWSFKEVTGDVHLVFFFKEVQLIIVFTHWN